MTDKAERHAARMAKKKALIDANIASADKEKGLLLVLTGNGTVGVAQFIKGRSDTGEEAFLGKQPGVEWHVLGEGFTWDTQNLERDIATAQRGWAVAQRMLADPEINLVVLDELTYLFSYGWLDIKSALADIAARPPMQHVVVTGRAAVQALLDAADTVSEIADVKHAYRAGIKAQPGVDL